VTGTSRIEFEDDCANSNTHEFSVLPFDSPATATAIPSRSRKPETPALPIEALTHRNGYPEKVNQPEAKPSEIIGCWLTYLFNNSIDPISTERAETFKRLANPNGINGFIGLHGGLRFRDAHIIPPNINSNVASSYKSEPSSHNTNLGSQ
jgi:hypothetical protein